MVNAETKWTISKTSNSKTEKSKIRDVAQHSQNIPTPYRAPCCLWCFAPFGWLSGKCQWSEGVAPPWQPAWRSMPLRSKLPGPAGHPCENEKLRSLIGACWHAYNYERGNIAMRLDHNCNRYSFTHCHAYHIIARLNSWTFEWRLMIS